jgi:hypothetical protein
MIFKNAYNYDSATRQVDTGDFDHILDETTDVGYAFAQVVDAAIDEGLADFSENFIAENDLLTQEQADALYELVGAVLAHVAELDPHTQYVKESDFATFLDDYSTTLEADALYEAIGAAAAAISAHNAAVNPHPEYLTPAEGDAAYEPIGGGGGAVATHAAASDPHTGYQKESEKAQNSGYAPLDSSGDLPLTHLPEHTHADAGTGGTIAVYPVRATATITTGSLAHMAEETGTKTLAAAYRLQAITTDRACRVRLYTTSAKRTADIARPWGVDPPNDSGLILEYLASGAITDVVLSPQVDGVCPTGTTVYYAIDNRSGGTSTVQVALQWLRQE